MQASGEALKADKNTSQTKHNEKPILTHIGKVAKTNSSAKKSLVAVLICTHNGDRFLEKQLDSVTSQDIEGLSVWASDDGSNDKTPKLLARHRRFLGKDHCSILDGPQQGFVANFLSLLYSPNIEAEYFAYCDQDDIWEPDRISRALAMLKKFPGKTPALYCSRTRLIDEKGGDIGFSPLFEKPPSFANALVQNVGGGNTMVMNKAARNLLCSASSKQVVSHDWWAYILISGAGGAVVYDSYPSVRYRQHTSNLVGSNIDWKARLVRLRMLMKGRFREWNNINVDALQEVRQLLTPENQYILDTFDTARNSWLLPRIRGALRSGIYRQTFLGNLGLIAAVILKKF